MGAKLSSGGSKYRFSVGFRFTVSKNGIELSVEGVTFALQISSI